MRRAIRLAIAIVALATVACHKPEPVDTCAQGLRPTPARLLTRFELDNTVKDLLGDSTRPGQSLPVEPLALGLDNNADLVQVTPDFQTRLLDVAEQVAHRAMLERRSELLPCTTTDAACGRRFIEAFGRRAFRRPINSDEVATFSALLESVRAAEGFDASIEATLTAMLMSPQFLYRLEPFATAEAVEPLSAYALASRLSYFMWGSAPDEALLRAAESGALTAPDELERHTRRLLDDPRSTRPASHFFSLWLHQETWASLEKDAALYPAFRPQMRNSWLRSTELFVDEVFSKKLSLAQTLSSPVLYVDEHMGSMYGVGPAPAGDFTRLEMSPAQRAGLLTQPGFLARLASPDQSSPVRRGVFVLEKVMCEVVAPPPPTVVTTPPKPDPSSTTRERFDIHGKTPSCRGCHERLDGIGFGFEHYDAMGAFRQQDNGKPVDATGQIVDANEASLNGPFDGTRELMTRLSTSRQVHDCMATQWYRYALARVETEADRCSLEAAQRDFFTSQGDFQTLRLAVVKTAAFGSHSREDAP